MVDLIKKLGIVGIVLAIIVGVYFVKVMYLPLVIAVIAAGYVVKYKREILPTSIQGLLTKLGL